MWVRVGRRSIVRLVFVGAQADSGTVRANHVVARCDSKVEHNMPDCPWTSGRAYDSGNHRHITHVPSALASRRRADCSTARFRHSDESKPSRWISATLHAWRCTALELSCGVERGCIEAKLREHGAQSTH
jgi:hypothetical protein